VDFLIKRDNKKRIRYASLQSDFAMKFFLEIGVSIEKLDTIYFYTNHKVYERHKAVFNVFLKLGFLFKLISILKYIPNFIGYPCYNFISNRRYTLFGKKDNCRIPSSEERSLFLEKY
jgi:predicted DCC family thiol-disulfide oxidoreductase YuxK